MYSVTVPKETLTSKSDSAEFDQFVSGFLAEITTTWVSEAYPEPRWYDSDYAEAGRVVARQAFPEHIDNIRDREIGKRRD